jgi:hypothetical protein
MVLSLKCTVLSFRGPWSNPYEAKERYNFFYFFLLGGVGRSNPCEALVLYITRISIIT